MQITINDIDDKFNFVEDTKLKLVSKLTIKEFNYCLN